MYTADGVAAQLCAGRAGEAFGLPGAPSQGAGAALKPALPPALMAGVAMAPAVPATVSRPDAGTVAGADWPANLLPFPAALVLCVLCWAGPCTGQSHDLGTLASPAVVEAWNIDVGPDGTGLPAGQGSVAQGRALYAARCASCHGVNGEGGPQDRLTGGLGSLASDTPIKTIGSFWPFATTLFDYVRRAMPYDAPQSLTADETYGVVAYLLHLNGVVAQGSILTSQSLPRIVMPNRDGFLPAH